MTTFNEIRVQLVDGTTGKTISESKLPAASLPEDFELGKTQLKIGGRQWTVIQADPATRPGYLESGSLILTLRPQDAVDAVPAPEPTPPPAPEPSSVASAPEPPAAPAPPRQEEEMRFPVPTVSDAVPETNLPGPGGTSEYLIMESDWRQIELISTQHDKAIDAEFYDIEGIVRDFSLKIDDGGRAYKRIFTRKRIKTPVAAQIPLADINDNLPQNTWVYGLVGFHSGKPENGAETVLPNSFALDFGMCALYGQLVNNSAAVIGLKFGSGNYGDREAIAAYLDRIMTTHSLVLVDWCWRRKITGASAIASYLQKKYAEQR